jgi:uncharacterized protein YjbI with pentapeptide repeats
VTGRKRLIDAMEACRCIKAGMDDAEVMKRFRLSAKGLESLLDKLTAAGVVRRSDLENRKHELYESVVMNVRGDSGSGSSPKKRTVRISPKEATKSIRSGMDDVALMQQFNLSAVGVRKLFEKLVAAGELSRGELEARMSDSQAQIAMDWERVERPPTRRVHASLHPGERPGCFFERSDRGAVAEKRGASSDNRHAYLKHAVESSAVTKEQDEASSHENARTFEIRRRSSRKLVFKGEASSMKALVERAVAAGIDLSYADLSGTNLSAADLAGAVLRGADLSRANLVRADLSLAKLSGAILASAELFAADLCQADLAQADLSDSNLTAVSAVCAHFEAANLSEANFTNADLTAANLRNAQLFHANLKNTLLKGTALEQAHIEFAKVHNVISDEPPQEEHYVPAPFLETARQEPGLTGFNPG